MKKNYFLFLIAISSLMTMQAQWVDSTKTISPADTIMSYSLYGNSVAIDDNFAVVGSYGYRDSQGCAYILADDGTNWDTIAQLTPSDGSSNDYFGVSVSISGDYVIVGAYYNDDNGAAYIFEKPSTGWANATETAKLTASDGDDDDFFGNSVSISGDYVIVGAYGDDDVTSYSGAAYIFEKPSTGWVDATETAKLTASDVADAAYGYQFGTSVSISEEYAVVGANVHDNWRGAAYIFEKPLTGWTNATETALLTASDATAGTSLGTSVSISGDYVIAGAAGDDENGDYSGAAYIFEKPSTGWIDATEIAKLTASDGAEDDYLGNSVCISGDYAIVGTYNDDSDKGSAYIFEKPSTGWTDADETAKLTASDGAEDDFFGKSVCISEEFAIVGAFRDNDNGTASGAAYIFGKPSTGWVSSTEEKKFVPFERSSYEYYYGYAVSIDSNIAIVGSYGYNDGQGCAYILADEGAGWDTVAKLTASDGAASREIAFNN